MQAVCHGLYKDGLYIVGRDIVAPQHQRMCLGSTQQGNACAWRQALHKPLAAARSVEQILDVMQQCRRCMDVQHSLLQAAQLIECDLRRQRIHHAAVAVVGQQLQLGLAIGVAKFDAHQKTVQLALG